MEGQFTPDDFQTYTFGDFRSLRAVIDWLLSNPERRASLRWSGHATTADLHTYTHRVQTILDTIRGGR
jgi:spore maturation protein CgeB